MPSTLNPKGPTGNPDSRPKPTVEANKPKLGK